MDHDHALRIAAVEKYLLDELPQDERDRFEEHYFDCAECALDLRAAAAFLDQAKKELAKGPRTRPVFVKQSGPNFWSFLWQPSLVVPALVVLLLIVGYQQTVTLPRLTREAAELRAPEILPTLSLATADSRGGGLASLDSHGKPFLLQFDIPGDARFLDYTCSLLSPSGATLWHATVSPEQAQDTVFLQLPAMKTSEGTYVLRVEGNSSEGQVDLARYRFALKSPK